MSAIMNEILKIVGHGPKKALIMKRRKKAGSSVKAPVILCGDRWLFFVVCLLTL
jgi:hypothetical protein